MQCHECGAEISDMLSLCPQCGAKVEGNPSAQPQQLDNEPSDADPAGGKSPVRWQRLRPIILWVMGFLCLLTLSVGAGAYGGLYQGERDRAQERHTLADQHYQAGLEALESGDYDRAIAEFEYVLTLNKDHPLANQGIAEAEARIAAANVTPTPTSESQRAIVTEDLYLQAVEYYDAERWQEAASTLTQLRVLDIDYKTDRVEEMLYESFYNAGMELLEDDRFEEGIFYLDQAVALRPLDEKASTQRSLAMQYMTARGYWGVDWEECIARFEELYTIAPAYKDVFQRLYRAHVNYADAWYAQGEMCPAEDQYAQALQLLVDENIEQKRAEAADICSIATPAPIPSMEGTETITITELPAAFTSGRLAYPLYNTQTGLSDIYVLSIDGHLTRMAAGADQPSWLWSGGALGYRDLAVGLSLVVPGGAAPQQLPAPPGAAWPTFSPDGARMAYAAQDAAGIWQVYIAPLDGSAEPTIHSEGKGPAWGPSGLLAWTGCDAEGTCGIMVDNPDDDQPPARLTASGNDIGLSWAPGGGTLAYMSNVTGNWEIYRLGVSGGIAVLTDNPATDGLPAWAPDGSGIAFASNRDGAWALYVMGPNGENPQKILTLGPNMPNWTAQRLSWAP